MSDQLTGKAGALYLIPVPIIQHQRTERDSGRDDELERIALDLQTLSPHCRTALRSITTFVVENNKSARKILKAAATPHPLTEINLITFDKHRTHSLAPEAANDIIRRLKSGEDVGVLSESGCPAIADPGSVLVATVQANKLRVIPLVGPSSILLALMGSGLGGQLFTFHGYLPKEQAARLAKLKSLEQQSATQGMTQLFIETPYRNKVLFADILSSCAPTSLLCLATNITASNERIITQNIKEWRHASADFLEGSPTVFVLKAQ